MERILSSTHTNPDSIIKFFNHCIFFTLRRKIVSCMNAVLFLWKKSIKTNFLVFFFEAVHKLKPSVGFHYYILKRKNRKRIIKLKIFFLKKTTRWNKGVYWLYCAVLRYKDFSFIYKMVGEIYTLNIYNKSYALNYKLTHYGIILSQKLSKHFFW